MTIDYVTSFHPMYTTSTVLHGSLGWPFPMLICKYIFFQIKYTDAILSKSTRKLLSFEISKMLIAVFKINLLCHLGSIIFFSAHFRSLYVLCLSKGGEYPAYSLPFTFRPQKSISIVESDLHSLYWPFQVG